MTNYKPTVGITKRSWIRNSDIPAGQPAPGKISCPCGQAPESNFADGNNVICKCGIVYDSYGWILINVEVL
jgi:hypothetical protein